MNETTTGKLTVWLTDGSIESAALEICSGLTMDGERLLVLDAAGCCDPSRISRASAAVATSLHILRIPAGAELQTAVWSSLRTAQERTQARRVLLVGVLDHLYGREILTRDAARALGRIKLVLEALADSGLDVTVLCKTETTELGARRYLLPSLCASASEVHHWPLASQQYVDRASAAIA